MMIPKHISDRITWAIEFAWVITVDKIVNGEIKVNKEASLQMHYSTILKTVLDLIKFTPKDRIEIELETTVKVGTKPYIIDILLTYTDGIVSEKHSIELKCYKTISSSGGKRGAGDIFMYSVYLDIYYSELYVDNKFADSATCLILTDYENFINPKSKKTKNWTYDISQGHSIKGGHFKTSIGGKNVDFNLTKTYKFNWQKNGDYWTTLLRPE
ncbi:MAG: hypothetical protein R2794_12905 [Chitinophagales bacterium]